jgi:hypothetical protein
VPDRAGADSLTARPVARVVLRERLNEALTGGVPVPAVGPFRTNSRVEAGEYASKGIPIRYIRSTFTPQDGRPANLKRLVRTANHSGAPRRIASWRNARRSKPDGEAFLINSSVFARDRVAERG